MLANFRRPSLTLLALPALLSSCHTYRPMVASTPASGVRVRAELTDLGTVELARYVGPGAGAIEGRVLQATDSIVTLGVLTVRNRNGIESYWKGERVAVPRELVSTLSTRTLSRSRTTLAAGTLVGVAGAVAMLFASGAIGGRRGGGGGGSGER